ncbi:hypothetical protein [Trueperella sp. LYQ143]|uniref:hypothetical protein n=1 Tax=Trueperella sp. LYQ143 TaxID=3391059 RepID=UPI003982F51E
MKGHIMKKLLSVLCSGMMVAAAFMCSAAPAHAATATITKVCSTNAIVTAVSAVPNPARHVHTYVASSGAKQVEDSRTMVIRHTSGSGYYRATVTLKTSTHESFTEYSASCQTIG